MSFKTFSTDVGKGVGTGVAVAVVAHGVIKGIDAAANGIHGWWMGRRAGKLDKKIEVQFKRTLEPAAPALPVASQQTLEKLLEGMVQLQQHQLQNQTASVVAAAPVAPAVAAAPVAPPVVASAAQQQIDALQQGMLAIQEQLQAMQPRKRSTKSKAKVAGQTKAPAKVNGHTPAIV